MTDQPQTPPPKPEIVNRAVSMSIKDMALCTRNIAHAMNAAQKKYEAEEVVVATLYLLGDCMRKMGAVVNLKQSVLEALPAFCAGYNAAK